MTEDEPRQDPEPPRDARFSSLDERLRRAQADEAVRTGRARQKGDGGYRLGMRVLSELIGPPFGGALIGWLLDSWLGTFPWLLLALLFVGFGIGFRNIVRLSKTPPPPGPGAGS